MHCIEKPVDEVYSTKGPEWHNLADHVSAITPELVKRLCPTIHEMQLVGMIDGQQVSMPDHKALVADYREARPEVVNADGTFAPHAFVPLHIPKNSYKVITNCELFEALQKAIEGIDAEIVSAGTLGGGKRAFFSVDLKGESEKKINGDDFLALLGFVTSHDGTLAAKGYDTMTRIVCQNTLDWSLTAAGAVGFNVYHTGNAGLCVAKMGELINEILKGRAQFREQMELLANVAVSPLEALEIATGYFVIGQTVPGEQPNCELSKRARNAAEEIALLYSRGKGNNGRTAYDLLNGATEYWSHGSGVGKSDKKTKWEKVSSANFGNGAEHKRAFVNVLTYQRDLARELGKRALAFAIPAK